jgi:hypothetical protein
MSREKPLLILFDGNALVHRAFHALPPLTMAKTGEMINAVQGFANTLLKLLRENKPDYWAIAFDTHPLSVTSFSRAIRRSDPGRLMSLLHKSTVSTSLPMLSICPSSRWMDMKRMIL